MTTASEKHREEYKKKGFVQINPWIPEDRKAEILEFCKKAREEKKETETKA